MAESVAKKTEAGFRLTDRDFDLFGFLLDQKFASLQQIYFYRFDRRKAVTDALPENFWVTRQRLQKLCKHGFIETVKVYTEGKSLYILSHFGFTTFQSRRPTDAYALPVKGVDFRSYEHDTRVNDCRIAIERTGKVMKWLPERRIRMKGFESEFSWDELPKEIVPDGVFISSKGERIAFELETSPRKRGRYMEKKQAYQSVMMGSSPLIHRVFWVGFTDRVYGDLKEVCGGSKAFYVESYSHFLSKLWVPAAQAKAPQARPPGVVVAPELEGGV